MTLIHPPHPAAPPPEGDDEPVQAVTPGIAQYLDRLALLEAEQEAILERISERAGEWYRANSGRTHFHALEFKGADATSLHFITPTRNDSITVVIPREWFDPQ